MGEGLAEDDVSMIRNPFLQLLLEIATTVLIFAQAGNFTNKVLESSTGKAINWLVRSGVTLAVGN